MAAWGAIPALTGFRYSAISRTFHLAASTKPQQGFWSTGHAWGTYSQKPSKRQIRLELQVLHGSLNLKTLELGDGATLNLPRSKSLSAPRSASFAVPL